MIKSHVLYRLSYGLTQGAWYVDAGPGSRGVRREVGDRAILCALQRERARGIDPQTFGRAPWCLRTRTGLYALQSGGRASSLIA